MTFRIVPFLRESPNLIARRAGLHAAYHGPHCYCTGFDLLREPTLTKFEQRQEQDRLFAAMLRALCSGAK